MKDTLVGIIHAVRSNFWFIPSVLAAVAVVAGLLVVEADLALQGAAILSLQMSIDSARLVLSTIAGSMITVASLVFSMTLVALTTVSQQLGPRLLMRFMDDRPTQVVLGIFVATFLFSLMVLMQIGETVRGGMVPGLAVTLAALLAVVALGGMIHFFDHVSKRIQADTMISELGSDLDATVKRLVARSQSDQDRPSAADEADIARCFLRNDRVRTIHQPRTGYVERLMAIRLGQLCASEDLVVRSEIRPGQYVLEGQAVLTVASPSTPSAAWPEDILERLSTYIVITNKRHPEEAVEFEIDALVEIALRALSPGINDPFTAMTCIDHLANGIRLLMTVDAAPLITRDAEGAVRIIHKVEPFERLLQRAFEPLIDAAGDSRMVLARIAQLIDELIELEPTENALKALIALRSYGRVHAPMNMPGNDA